MGTGAKIALVALLIVMVVVVAKVVQNSGEGDAPAEQSKASQAKSQPPRSRLENKSTTASRSTGSNTPTSRNRRVNGFNRQNVNASGAYRRPSTTTAGASGARTTAGAGERRPPTTARTTVPGAGAATGPAILGTATTTTPGVRSQDSTTIGLASGVSTSTESPPLASDTSLEGLQGATQPPRGESSSTAATDVSLLLRKTPVRPGATSTTGPSTGGATSSTPGNNSNRRFSANLPRNPARTTLSEIRPAGAAPDTQSVATALTSTATNFPRQHTVRTGDSYWVLAKKYYGQGRFYNPIMRANNDAKLQPGVVLTIPAPPAVKESVTPARVPTTPSVASAANSTPPRAVKATPSDANYFYYTVGRGETLSGIAKKFYGNGRAYQRIQDANRALRYETLRAGAKIRIPKE